MKKIFENKKLLFGLLGVLVAIVIIIVVIILTLGSKRYTISFNTDGGNSLESITAKEKETITFVVKSGTNNKIFGSISTKQIYEELNKLGYSSIDKRKIFIDHPITSLGTHIVKIELFKDILANVKVKVISK